MNDMNSDASDLTAAAEGDREAFARLYQRHAGVVLSLCRRGGSLVEAEDAMQETFVRAFRKMHQLREPKGFSAWLYSIARRVCSERRRATQRRERHENHVVELRMANPAPDPSPETCVDQAEQLDRLSVALDGLPDDERLAIHLCYLDPNPPRAAAEALGVSRSGYYKLVAKARKRLAVALREVQAT